MSVYTDGDVENYICFK